MKEENMNKDKPISIAIEELKNKIIAACNVSGLPVSVIDLVVDNLYRQIHMQAVEIYRSELKEFEDINIDNKNNNREEVT